MPIAAEPAMTPAEIANAHSTATTIVIGLIAARLDELFPGSRREMLEQLNEVVAHASADPSNSQFEVQEISRFAENMLRSFNT